MSANYKILGRQVPVRVVMAYFTERVAPAVPTPEQFEAWAVHIPREESREILAYYARRAAASMLSGLPDDALELSPVDFDTLDRAVCLMAGV